MRISCIIAIIVGGIMGRTVSAADNPIDTVTIPESEYVTVSSDGHLTLAGKRVRFWGSIGAFTTDWGWTQRGIKPGDSADVRAQKVARRRKAMTAVADRLAGLGFNMWRCWHQPSEADYVMGDGSNNDLLGFFMNELNKRGIKVWMSGINGEPVRADDTGIVKDPATAGAWKKAIQELEKRGQEASTWCVAAFWDPRMEAIGIRAKLSKANFRNLYKGGIRLADDPQVVVWELSNEEWWLRKMLRGEWQRLPDFFKRSLIARWNGFLRAKYRDDTTLAKAWLAPLPGESIKGGTVQLLPLLTNPGVVMPNDANPNVKKVLSAAAEGKFTRDDFNRQRGADVIEFLLGLQVAHKKAEYAALKKHGESCRLSPIIFDTGEGFMTQSLWLHQNADAVSVCTYMTGIHNDPTHDLFPWVSGLTEPPRLAWNVPWVETQRVPNKPYLIYEIGYENPGKYRSEYPYRVAFLAAIQDFDAICWHTQNGLLGMDSCSYQGQLQYSVSWNDQPQGLHYASDEVMQSAMQAASEIFKNSLVKAPENPTTYVFGTKTLYDPASMDYGVAYGQYGQTILPTTYRYGTRMYCDTARKNDTAIGPVISRGVYEPNPYRPTPEMELDWRKGFLRFDAPGTAMYSGFFANYGGPVKFDNGIILDSVNVVNPPDMPYPVRPDELYISFCIAACDGKPIAETKRAVLSLVSTSFNSGFKIDESKIRKEYSWQYNPGATIKAGRTPVLVARAGARISASALAGMRYLMRDWRLQPIGEGTVGKDGVLKVPADKPIYIMELTR